MTLFTLEYPVHAPDNTELFPAGISLSIDPGTHSTGILKGYQFKEELETVSINQYGSFNKDIYDLIEEKQAFQIIFMDNSRKALVADMIRSVSVPLPVLEILEHFKSSLFYFYRHTLRVFALSSVLATHLLRDEEEKKRLGLAALCFDIGMISIPNEVLNKKAPLTKSEKKQIDHHTIAGYLLLNDMLGKEKNYPAFAALNHHERRNGNGYPAGISIADPISDIITVADIFDALTSLRPFRPNPFENRAALDVLIGMADDGEVDFQTVRALVAENRKEKPAPENCLVSMEKRGTPPEKNNYGVITGS